MDRLKDIAREALDHFRAIADAASEGLHQKGVSLASLANPNVATSETIAREMQSMNEQRIGDCLRLRREPTIARMVVTDDDDNRRVIYVSPVGTVNVKGVTSCSYMSGMGRLLELRVGQGEEIHTGSGKRWYYLQEKLLFKTGEWVGEWDSRPSEYFRDNERVRTIKSLRELLHVAGVPAAESNLLAKWLANEDEETGDGNIVFGIQRDALNAMELRVRAALDEYQGAIMRLPLDSRIALLGPPGTGKTTTLVKRLRKTLDFQHIDQEERELVQAPDGAGLDHADSWIMFTPTELLRLYVKEAFGKQGIPVHDERIWTWDVYREQVGKRDLGFLRTPTRRGLSINDRSTNLQGSTLRSQIAWFEAFDAFQQDLFIRQLKVEAERLAKAEVPRFAVAGRRVLTALDRSGNNPLQLVGELAGFAEELRSTASEGSAEIVDAFTKPLDQYVKVRPNFLEALMQFVVSLSVDTVEDGDDDLEEDDDEADDGQTLIGRKLALETFRRAMRARAIAQASGRSPGVKSRTGRMLAFLLDSGLDLPDLKELGGQLLLQRAARRLARGAATWLSGVPLRYRQFRRAMRAEKLWYSETQGSMSEVHPAEVDMILLAILSQAREMSGDALLRSRIGELNSPLLEAVARLRRNQVLVDEATDFSPLQLAIMRSLSDLRTGAIFVSGDFNQRLTVWGSRTEAELLWAIPNVARYSVEISYRQSRALVDFAVTLARLQGAEVKERAPEDYANPGYGVALGIDLPEPAELAGWLGNRIREIEMRSNGVMPTLAIFTEDESGLAPLAEALNTELAALNIRAVPCFQGQTKGLDGHVRIFDVQHVKGLEFEAVFFVNVDKLADLKPELFDRYVYVGATRAATFLGLTTTGSSLPLVLEQLRPSMLADWG